MRHLQYIFLTALLIAASLASCDKASPTAKEEVLSKLTQATWTLQSVTVDNNDQFAFYQGLTLKFTETTYATTNGKGLWPASGTWSFVNEDATIVKRDDGLEVSVDVTGNKLQLTFTWTGTLGAGRLHSVGGLHVMTFTR